MADLDKTTSSSRKVFFTWLEAEKKGVWEKRNEDELQRESYVSVNEREEGRTGTMQRGEVKKMQPFYNTTLKLICDYFNLL